MVFKEDVGPDSTLKERNWWGEMRGNGERNLRREMHRIVSQLPQRDFHK